MFDMRTKSVLEMKLFLDFEEADSEEEGKDSESRESC
jgi:hypothetical protein